MSGRRAQEAIGATFVAATAMLALIQSYARWLHPLIDTGRDLYIPERILAGAKLYRDIRYEYPPLVPYLLAAITRVTGSSLDVYTAIGIAQSIAICALLWLIARKLAGPVAAFITAMLFVSINFCGATTGVSNFVFPFSYAATIGMLFLLACYACLLYEQPWPAMAFALLASWCKVEYALVAVLAMLLLRWRFAIFAALGAVTLAIACWYFDGAAWLLGTVSGPGAWHFYAGMSGVARWQSIVAESALVIIAAGVVCALLSRFERFPIPVAIAAIAISILPGADRFFRAFGIVQFALLAWALVRERELLMPALFSVASTLRVPLNAAPAAYGFVLVLPLYVLVAYVLFVWLPKRGVYSRRASLLWLPALLVMCASSLYVQRNWYGAKTYAIHSTRGTFDDGDYERAAAIDAFLAYAHGGTLVVMPEGVTLNYLGQMPSTISFHTFTPAETASPAVEERIIAELAAHPPDRIALVTREVREFGYRGFGIDYDQRLLRWTGEHYRGERVWRGSHFELTLLRRAIPRQ